MQEVLRILLQDQLHLKTPRPAQINPLKVPLESCPFCTLISAASPRCLPDMAADQLHVQGPHPILTLPVQSCRSLLLRSLT